MNIRQHKQSKLKKAFTLAETLITLVIVGIVSALTVPLLIAKYHEQQTVTAVKKFYSEFSQAYNNAIAANGPPDTWDWQEYNDEPILNLLAPYLRISTRCGVNGTKDKCFGNNTYKTLNPKVDWYLGNPGKTNYYTSARLDNGAVFFLDAQVQNNKTCNLQQGTSQALKTVCGKLGVDINGYKKPNALGKDTFVFRLTKYGVIPWGSSFENQTTSLNTLCNNKSSNVSNGYACSAWIIEKGNMDYLHKDVSW